MAQKNNKIIGKLEVDLPTLTIAASGTNDNVDREYYHPITAPSDEIVAASIDDLGIQLEPQQQEQFVESIDVVKTYASEMEFALGPLKFKIKRSPKKVITSYKG